MRTPLLVPVLGLLAALATADGKSKPEPGAAPAPVTTEHVVTLRGVELRYRATAGTIALKDDKDEPTAEVFHVAYEKAGVADPAQRPITFVFNGGPGAASVWLHLGAVGPRRVRMDDEGKPLPPPGRVVDNAETWLEFTDLVFIDPVGTGYSRPLGKHKQEEFSGLNEDTASVGEFIRLFTTQHGRWASPKFLAGESYGTTRAANLADHLQDRFGMYLNGIVLVSAVLDFSTLRGGRDSDLPHVLFLPTFTATAFYHGRLDGELTAKGLRPLLAEVEEFATTRYLVALARGDALPAEERAAIAARLARYTGLDPAYVERSDLRIPMGRFNKELLRDRRRTVGRLDSRIEGIDRDAAGGDYEYDPSMAAISGPFSQAFLDYVRRELHYPDDGHYKTLGNVGRWKTPEGRYVDVTDSLRQAMTNNRNLRVMVASGYYDLATPFFATDYTVRHLGLAPELRDHMRVRYYEAGHMMYVHTPSRQKLRDDVAEFYAWALPPGGQAAAPAAAGEAAAR